MISAPSYQYNQMLSRICLCIVLQICKLLTEQSTFNIWIRRDHPDPDPGSVEMLLNHKQSAYIFSRSHSIQVNARLSRRTTDTDRRTAPHQSHSCPSATTTPTPPSVRMCIRVSVCVCECGARTRIIVNNMYRALSAQPTSSCVVVVAASPLSSHHHHQHTDTTWTPSPSFRGRLCSRVRWARTPLQIRVARRGRALMNFNYLIIWTTDMLACVWRVWSDVRSRTCVCVCFLKNFYWWFICLCGGRHGALLPEPPHHHSSSLAHLNWYLWMFGHILLVMVLLLLCVCRFFCCYVRQR